MLETCADVVCPHCWETITLILDLSVEQQAYIEDCEVCCRPIAIAYATADGQLTELRVESAA
jgi:Cysteine-rich CPXCG